MSAGRRAACELCAVLYCKMVKQYCSFVVTAALSPRQVTLAYDINSARCCLARSPIKKNVTSNLKPPTTQRTACSSKTSMHDCHICFQVITSPMRKSSIMSNTRGGCCGPWKPAVASPPAFLRMARPPGCSST